MNKAVYDPFPTSVIEPICIALPVLESTIEEPPVVNKFPLVSAKVTVTVLTAIPFANTGLVADIVVFTLLPFGLELSGLKTTSAGLPLIIVTCGVATSSSSSTVAEIFTVSAIVFVIVICAKPLTSVTAVVLLKVPLPKSIVNVIFTPAVNKLLPEASLSCTEITSVSTPFAIAVPSATKISVPLTEATLITSSSTKLILAIDVELITPILGFNISAVIISVPSTSKSSTIVVVIIAFVPPSAIEKVASPLKSLPSIAVPV